MNTAPINEATERFNGITPIDSYHWFKHVRFRLVQHVIHQKNGEAGSLLDFGCGKGRQLSKFKSIYPMMTCEGYEPYLRTELADSSLCVHKSLESLADRVFDFITALDVIEHIEDDSSALKQIRCLLKDNGILIINVPASMRLWSPLDAAYGHYRRYSKASLIKALSNAGFAVVEAFYILPFIYPAFLLRKYIYRILDCLEIQSDEHTVMKYFPIDPLKIPSMLVALELAMINKTRLRSPFGSSLFLYATKTAQ